MIEEQVADTQRKLKHNLEMMQRKREQNERHAKLDEKREEYEHKMKIIQEIEREKSLRDQHDNLVKEIAQ